MSRLVGIDIGGTFTDVVTFDEASGRLAHAKRPSYPDDLVRGIRQALSDDQVPLNDVSVIRHGTTVVINAILQRVGATTALITTQGFRDVLEIGRTNRPQSYNMFYDRDPALVPRDRRYEALERVAADGRVIEAVSVAQVRDLARGFPEDVESVGVCLLHSYANPTHELEIADILRAELPGVHVSVSHELSREFREYERTSTVVMNAYVGPVVDRYLSRLVEALAEDGFAGSLYLMESSGGVTSVPDARARPIVLVESGPAAGAVAVAQYAQRLDYPNAIAFDMGGTTAKAVLVENGEPLLTSEYYVPTYDHGFPLHVAAVDIVEVGTGGGSIAALDDVGALSVGPRSAQAVPGPACYGLGGTEPTVTDANLLLGRLSAEAFLGGEMQLDFEAAQSAMARIATSTELEPVALAAGIVRLANFNMAAAIRKVSLERGRDPREFVLFAYGGAGPLHACALARELAIPTVVVPKMPGVFSAFGMLLADLRHDFGVTVLQPLAESGIRALEPVFAEIEREAARWRRSSTVPEDTPTRTRRFLDCRYVGQEFSIGIPADGDDNDGNVRLETLRARFEAEYERRYGHAFSTLDVEIVNARAVTYIDLKKPPLDFGSQTADAAGVARREVFFEGHGLLAAEVRDRDALLPDDQIDGPAIIEEYGATTVIGPHDRARVNDDGLLVISIDTEGAA